MRRPRPRVLRTLPFTDSLKSSLGRASRCSHRRLAFLTGNPSVFLNVAHARYYHFWLAR